MTIYLKTKKDARIADIIITNHSFLLTDLIVSDNRFCHRLKLCIIDEGHHFEKTAGKYFGSKFDYASTRFLLQQMGLLNRNNLPTKLKRCSEENSIMERKNLSIWN